MQSHASFNFDPFAKVRSLSGILLGLLFARAAMRFITYAVLRAVAPGPQQMTAESFDTLRMIDTGLFGLENLLTLVSMIVFFVWIYRVIKAARASGVVTAYSPGMAVGGWFIPIANIVLPWLTVRDALRSVQRATALAGIWWIVWLINMSLAFPHQLLRQLSMVPELGDAIPYDVLEPMYSLAESTFWPYVLSDTAAWALLAVIVVTVKGAVSPRQP